MLRKPACIFFASVLAACSTGPNLKQTLPGVYVLKFSRSERLLRHNTIQSSSLRLSESGQFEQDCIGEQGNVSKLVGTWQVEDDWILFDNFLDCAGAWPNDSVTGANLHFFTQPTPGIVVEPDLGVMYILLSPSPQGK